MTTLRKPWFTLSMESIDFQQAIKDLRAAGYTDSLLARLCDCSRQHIGKIRNGQIQSVGHWIGAKIEKLHKAL